MAEIAANQRLLVGENPASSMLRACLYPDQLTDEDRIVLINLYQAAAGLAYRAMALEQIGEFGSDWENGARFNYQAIARTEFGRNWLAITQIPTLRLSEIRNEVVASTDGQDCANELRHSKKIEDSP